MTNDPFSHQNILKGESGYLGGMFSRFVTSSGEQRCVSFSSLFCCGHCGSCGFHCHHGGRGHFCYGCVDARESSFLSLIHFTIRRNRQNFELQIKKRVSDKQRDGGIKGQMDRRTNPQRDARAHLKTLFYPFPFVNTSLEPSFS